MPTPVLELAGLGRRLGERWALRDVTLTLEPGRTLAVLGPNGAGKTTLLRVLATLLRPSAGTARVLGHGLPGEGWRVRGALGFLGHEPLLHRELTARENLRFHARLHGAPLARVDALLERAGLAARADDPLRTYSKGMVQRAAVCRAVLHEPRLLLLDEPWANLDPGARAALEPLIGRAAAGGPARVVVSHEPHTGVADADLVLGLRAGRPAFLRPAADVDPATLESLYAHAMSDGPCT